MEHIFQPQTREELYRPYRSWPAAHYAKLKAAADQSPYRTSFHIQPPYGLLNDPNGFCYFNGLWHVFYQYYPAGTCHGLKSWYHVTSPDLVHWHNEGIALNPDTKYDSQGVYSGSAKVMGDQVFLFYTGNVRSADWQRKSYQNGAWMNKAGQITKLRHPLIESNPEFTAEFRDPMMFDADGQRWLVIGAQDQEKQGRLAVYRAASDQLDDWQYQGPLNVGQADLGYMVECPNLVWVDHQPVVIYCPQGLSQETLSYSNAYPDVAVIGQKLDMKHLTIEGATPAALIDDGFDLYAMQAINAPDGRALGIAWVGGAETDYPTDGQGWSGCLTLVRELSVHHKHLYQYPVAEAQTLRQTYRSGTFHENSPFKAGQHYELQLTLDADKQTEIHLLADEVNQHYLALKLDSTSGVATLNRSRVGNVATTMQGTARRSKFSAHQKITVSVFFDRSVIEIFFNHGERVMTARVFPDVDEDYLFAENLAYEFWELANK